MAHGQRALGAIVPRTWFPSDLVSRASLPPTEAPTQRPGFDGFDRFCGRANRCRRMRPISSFSSSDQARLLMIRLFTPTGSDSEGRIIGPRPRRSKIGSPRTAHIPPGAPRFPRRVSRRRFAGLPIFPVLPRRGGGLGRQCKHSAPCRTDKILLSEPEPPPRVLRIETITTSPGSAKDGPVANWAA